MAARRRHACLSPGLPRHRPQLRVLSRAVLAVHGELLMSAGATALSPHNPGLGRPPSGSTAPAERLVSRAASLSTRGRPRSSLVPAAGSPTDGLGVSPVRGSSGFSRAMSTHRSVAVDHSQQGSGTPSGSPGPDAGRAVGISLRTRLSIDAFGGDSTVGSPGTGRRALAVQRTQRRLHQPRAPPGLDTLDLVSRTTLTCAWLADPAS